jgi:hypothetical protein
VGTSRSRSEWLAPAATLVIPPRCARPRPAVLLLVSDCDGPSVLLRFVSVLSVPPFVSVSVPSVPSGPEAAPCTNSAFAYQPQIVPADGVRATLR